ncbi:MAG: methylmalonyl Co-A mutase-associated GTPase MeaB [Deltaproteobacteria bacterium]|nr:methylmalonyl Co-A mutase-associated GTPase MeaB [Deltaproteobacteria bacterium]
MSGDLAKRILKGDVRAAARLLTLIENGDPRARPVLKKIYPSTGKAHVIGVTGAPGTGKSALIDGMTAELRRRKREVGILAVDPTSPFSGGALLGDRLRMREHFLDQGVFIRSLATRGGLGGISACLREAVQLLDAAGKEIVFVETIGVGQDQVEISTIVHTVLLVFIPGAGDEIQAMKAGLVEIADILVVNKADLPGAEAMFQQIGALLEDSGLPIMKTSAIRNEGIGLLIDALEKHRAELLASGDHRRRNLSFCRRQLLSLIQERLLAQALRRVGEDSIEGLVEEISERRLDPYSAAEKILKKRGL